MIGRVAWVLALLLLAGAVVVAQIDRRARYEPALATFVPNGIGGFAAEQRARGAILKSNGAVAVAQARALVRARPLPAGHLTMLAVAGTLTRDADTAERALEAASTRGWREPLPQIATAQAALEQDAFAIAAQRLSALMATGRFSEETRELTLALLAEPDGRKALAALYPGEGHWQTRALATLGRQAPPQDFMAWIKEVRAAGGAPDCTVLRQVAQRYSRNGEEAAAVRLPGAACA